MQQSRRSEYLGQEAAKWELPKIRGTLFWGPYKKDPTIQSTILGSTIFVNPKIEACFEAYSALGFRA